MRSLACDLIPYDWCPYKKRKLQIHEQREEDVKIQREDAIHKPGKEASEETNSAHTLISDFQPSGLWCNKCLWYCAPGTLENEYTIPLLMNADSLQRRNILHIFLQVLASWGNIHDFSTFFLEGILPLELSTCLPLTKTIEIPAASQIFPPCNTTSLEIFLYLLLHSNLQDTLYAPSQPSQQ